MFQYPAIFDGQKTCSNNLEKLNEALGWLNDTLSGHDFAVGNNLTVADFALVASVSTMIESGIDFSKYSNILTWVDRCKAKMPGYEEANGEGARKFGGFAKPKLP